LIGDEINLLPPLIGIQINGFLVFLGLHKCIGLLVNLKAEGILIPNQQFSRSVQPHRFLVYLHLKKINKMLSKNINIKMECGITLDQRMISNYYILENLRCYENLPAYNNVPYLASATPILRSFRCNDNNYVISYNRSTIIDSLILEITISYLLLRASAIPLGRTISNFSKS
jgi:hypothetical protein